MKIDFRNDNLVVFLNKKMVSEIDFFDKSEMEKYFKNLFLRIDDIFDISLFGCYDVNVYVDKYYGVVLEIIKSDDSFDCYNVVDMNICISNFSGFIYKLDNNNFDLNGKYYYYNGSFYFEPMFSDFIGFGFLIENSFLIYGSECYKIKENGFLLDNKLVSKIV